MALEGKSSEEVSSLAALADDMLSDPKYAGVFKRMLKAKNPNLSMPEIELEDRTVAALAARDKKIQDLEDRNARQEAQSDASSLYEALRESGTVTTRASFSDLVKWASENGFLTSEQGLRKAAMQRSVEQEAAEPTPQTLGPGSFSVAEGEDSKKFMENATAHARVVASRAMDELRAARAKGTKQH